MTRCPYCGKIIYPDSQRCESGEPTPRRALHWVHELNFFAKAEKPIFQAVVRDGFQEGDENLAMFLERGWIEEKDGGFVITESGRARVRNEMPRHR